MTGGRVEAGDDGGDETLADTPYEMSNGPTIDTSRAALAQAALRIRVASITDCDGQFREQLTVR